jgi:hypothetical protein
LVIGCRGEFGSGGGAVAAVAIERSGHFDGDLLRFVWFASNLSFDFQAHELGFVRGVFGTNALAEIEFHFAKSPLKRAFCSGFEAGEGFEELLIVFDPMLGVQRHIPLDLFEAETRAFEEPMIVNKELDEGFFDVIGGLVFVPPLVAKSFVFGRIFMAQD